jgi:hypothetical protein
MNPNVNANVGRVNTGNARAVNVPQKKFSIVDFFERHWGKLLIVAIVAGIIVGIVTGSVKVKAHIRKCAGGTPGIGTGKEKECLCNSSTECASGDCHPGVVAMASGAAAGKCS